MSFRNGEAVEGSVVACSGYPAGNQQILPFGRNDNVGRIVIPNAPRQKPVKPLFHPKDDVGRTLLSVAIDLGFVCAVQV